MAGRRNQILILEDDDGMLQVLVQAFQKQGHTVYGTARPSEAEELLNTQPIGVMYIDCLLPEVSGVDFCVKVRNKFPSTVLDIILMSGVFVDQSFVKDGMRQAQAQGFLKKPFELKEAINFLPVPTGLKDKDESHPRRILYQLFGRGKVTVREKKKAIEALDDIHGYDLPFIYSLLVESKASGHLNILGRNGKIYGISFSKGFIVNADVPDKESYLGKLLVELGFILQEDLNEGLNVSTKLGKRLGDILIKECLVSPHALDMALAHQMSLRLAMTVTDQNVTVNFVESEIELTSPQIDPDNFSEFLHDWIISQISAQWLRNHYMQWGDSVVMKTPMFDPKSPVLRRPLVEKLDGFVERLTEGKTLNEIINLNIFPEEALHKGLHFLLTKGLLGFGGRMKQESVPERIKNLKKFIAQFTGKSKVEVFEIMSQMVGGSEADPDFVLDEFAQLMGSMPSPNQSELNQVYRTLKKMAQDAYDSVKSGEATLIREQRVKGEMEARLKAAAAYEEAKNQLQRGVYKPALESLKKIQQLDPHLERIRLYIIWAKIGILDGIQKKDKLINEIEMDILQVPPNEKLEAIYHFVTGLLAKAKGQFPAARKSFEKVLAADPNMIAARRELNHIKNLEGQKKDVLNRDLRDIVGSFFKKK